MCGGSFDHITLPLQRQPEQHPCWWFVSAEEAARPPHSQAPTSPQQEQKTAWHALACANCEGCASFSFTSSVLSSTWCERRVEGWTAQVSRTQRHNRMPGSSGAQRAPLLGTGTRRAPRKQPALWLSLRAARLAPPLTPLTATASHES